MGVFVVTGSAGGIGGAIASKVEAEGHRVIGVDLRHADVEADLSSAAGRRAAIEAVTDEAGASLDGLLVCAGLGPTVAGDLIVQVNYFGAVDLLDGLRPLLAAGTEPAAVAISSNSLGTVPPDDRSLIDPCLAGDVDAAMAAVKELHPAFAYGMSKRALALAVRRRAPEWAGEGIRLNALAPGPIQTPLYQATLDDPDLAPFVEDFPSPMGVGAVEAVAEVAWFLCSAAGRHVTGEVLFVDGGTDAVLRPDVV